jgi:WD40 repeat protein
MTMHLWRCCLIFVALSLAALVGAAQQPDAADDPLPAGAKVRFGVTRPILRASPAVGLMPPGYANFLAPTVTGGVRRYDLGTGRPLDKTSVVGPGQVVVSTDGKRAAVARPGAVTVVDAATGKLILAVTPPDGVIIAGTPGVALSADGKVLAYGARGSEGNGAVVVWEVDTDQVLSVVETNQSAPVFPTLSPDGQTLVSHGPPAPAPTLAKESPDSSAKKTKPATAADPDALRTAQVWGVTSGKELFKARVTGMGGMVVAAAVSPAGDLIAISAGDGPIDLWDVASGKRRRTLLGRKGQGVRVAFSPDGKRIASVGPDYRIQQWSTDGEPIGITDPPQGIMIAPITGLSFVDPERVTAWLTAAGFAVAWEAPSGKLLSPVTDHIAPIASIAFAQDEKGAFTSGFDSRVLRWDLATGQPAETITLHPVGLPGQPLIGPVVVLSEDGARATWPRNPAEVFDVLTGESLFVVPPPSSAPAPVKFALSPDGMKLVTLSRQAQGKRSGACAIWDLATQHQLAEFEIPGTTTATAPGASLSRDGTRVVFATATGSPSGGQALRIVGFDAKTGKKLGEVENREGTGPVTVNVTVADESAAVITSNFGRVWSVDYVAGRFGKLIDQLPVRGEPPVHGPVAFSRDGKQFATGVVGEPFASYGVRVYNWPQGTIARTFIGHVAPVSALCFSPDGSLLASGAQDTSVLVWDLKKK